jgi:hypothetical protein
MNRKKPFRLKKSGPHGYILNPVPEIDQYIPEAVRYADKVVAASKIKGGKEVWDQLYHEEMNRLTHEAGLRVL